MKKCILLLIVLFLFPILVHAKEDVYVKSVEVEELYGDVVEKSDPKVDGMNINFDLKFSTVSSYAKYKITLINDSKEDYKLNENKKGDSDYFVYTYNFEDSDPVIKAGKTKVLFLTIEFGEKVPVEKFSNGLYNEETNLNINLGNIEKNPNTSGYISIITIIVLGIALIVFLYSKNKKNALSVVVLFFMMIPAIALALKEINISVKTKVEIDRSCNYKLVTNFNSFSATEDVKEVCMDLDDDYSYTSYSHVVGFGSAHPSYNELEYGYIDVQASVFPEGGYVRVYSDDTKENLLLEITKKDFPKYRYSVGTNSYYSGDYVSKAFVKTENTYIEKSEGVYAYMLGSSSEGNVKVDKGPWPYEQEDYNTITNFINRVNNVDVTDICGQPEPDKSWVGYDFKKFTNCRIYEDGKENVCGGHIYYADIDFSCEYLTR